MQRNQLSLENADDQNLNFVQYPTLISLFSKKKIDPSAVALPKLPVIEEIDPNKDDYLTMARKFNNLIVNTDYLRAMKYNNNQMLYLKKHAQDLILKTNELCYFDSKTEDEDRKIIIATTFEAIAHPSATTLKALTKETQHYKPLRVIAKIMLEIAGIVAVWAGLTFAPLIWPLAGLGAGVGLFCLAHKARGEEHRLAAGKGENIIRPV